MIPHYACLGMWVNAGEARVMVDSQPRRVSCYSMLTLTKEQITSPGKEGRKTTKQQQQQQAGGEEGKRRKEEKNQREKEVEEEEEERREGVKKKQEEEQQPDPQSEMWDEL